MDIENNYEKLISIIKESNTSMHIIYNQMCLRIANFLLVGDINVKINGLKIK